MGEAGKLAKKYGVPRNRLRITNTIPALQALPVGAVIRDFGDPHIVAEKISRDSFHIMTLGSNGFTSKQLVEMSHPTGWVQLWPLPNVGDDEINVMALDHGLRLSRGQIRMAALDTEEEDDDD